jgi:hypothetical protein
VFRFLVFAIAAILRPTAPLIAENLCLRQQLLVLQRRHPRPVVAQKPIRSQRMLIRDRDSRPCSEICPFSESGHRDRQNRESQSSPSPGYGLPYAMGGKGRISPERRRDRRSLWLRPRDVRTDDGVRRPREMRRSCQRKAVGSSGDPDSLYLATDAFCSDDNNENNKTKRDGGASH